MKLNGKNAFHRADVGKQPGMYETASCLNEHGMCAGIRDVILVDHVGTHESQTYTGVATLMAARARSRVGRNERNRSWRVIRKIWTTCSRRPQISSCP